jgi:biopolymer transport protein ExbB/TolQ
MKRLSKIMLITGITMLGAPLIGIVFTVVGMIGAFHQLEGPGISNPQALSQSIGLTLIATAGGLIIGIIGCLLVLAAVIVHFSTKSAAPSVSSPSPQ